MSAGSLPVDVAIRAPDGATRTILKAGAALPAEARAVFATQRVGETKLSLEVIEEDPAAPGDPLCYGTLAFELPRGLPANCWIPVFLRIEPTGQVRSWAKENLRRISVDALIDRAAAVTRFLK